MKTTDSRPGDRQLTPGFQGALFTERLADNWRLYRLTRSLVYVTKAGGVIEVPAGTETDLLSTPRLLWWLVPPAARGAESGVLHDHLYELLNKGEPHPLAPTRAAADAIFREALLAQGLCPGAAYARWAAVRAFGGSRLIKRLVIAG